MTQKRTAWYPPEIKPVRAGVYEVQYTDLPGKPFLGLWNGSCWLRLDDRTPFLIQGRYWRGLTRRAR